MAPGTSYHLAATWQSGTQHYYLNGVQVRSDTQVGSIGVLGDTAPHPYRLGSDSAGTDVSLGDPTLWVGYALSAQDVLNLRNRTVQPSAIAPSSIALRWSLSGSDGVAAQVGDPGLADASPSGLNLSSIVGSAPKYQAAALTYVVLPPLVRAMVAPSGEAIAIRPIDGGGNYVGVSSIQSGNDEQSFTLVGPTVGGTFKLTFNGQTTGPLNFTAVAPPRFGLWTIPVTPGAAVRISMTVPQAKGFFSPDVFCEIIENNLVTASANFDQDNIGSGDFTTVNDQNGGSGTSAWKIVFPSYAPTGSTISIRTSAASNQGIWAADGLHVQLIGSAGVAIYDDADSSHFSATGADEVVGGGFGQYYDGSFHIFDYGGGAGSTYIIDPSAVQAALQGLSTIGPGNVIVTAADGSNHTPLTAQFVGTMGAEAQPAIASSNPAVAFTHTVGGFVPSVVITPQGGTPGSPIACRGPWITEPTLTWAVYPLTGVTIAPTDSMSVTIPSGWMTTANGPLSPGKYPAENHVGGSMLPAFSAVPKTMGVGYNIQQDVYYGEALTFTNMAGRCGRSAIDQLLAFDSGGDPTLLALNDVGGVVNSPSSFQEGDSNKGNLNAPNGLYTFIWDGPAAGLSVGGQNTGFTEVPTYRNLTGTTDNRLVYNVQAGPAQYAPTIDMHWLASGPPDANGHYPCATKNVRIYPPDPSDPTGMTPWLAPSGKFHPSFLAKVAGTKSLRFMQALETVYNPYRDFADIKPATWTDRCSATRKYSVGVASCQPYTASTLDNPHIAVIKVTTVSPHGLFTGATIKMTGCGSATFTDGSTHALDPSDTGFGCVDVIDSTTFAWHALTGPKSSTGFAMTNTTTGGTMTAVIGTSWPLQDVVDLCNLVGCDCWFNVPVTISDACCDSVADFLAANLNAGLKVHLEFGNECWNFDYATFAWLRVRNFQLYGDLGDGYTSAYAQGQDHVNNRFAARFAAAGRGGDLIRTFASQGAVPEVTNAILSFAKAQTPPYQVQEVAIAPYFDSVGCDPAVANLLSVGQCLDVLELNTDDPGYPYVSGHRPSIDPYYPGIPIACYEGGPESLIPGLDLGNGYLYPKLYPFQHALHRHPRMYGVMLRFLQGLQDDGSSLLNDFYLFGGSSAAAWSAYEWYNQPDGTGSLTADALNASDPEAMDLIKSEVGGAIHHWLSLVGAAGSTLAAGSATAGSATNTTASAIATEATGATGTIAHQWYRSTVLGQIGSPVSGQTTLTLADTGLTPGTTYHYQIEYTDNDGSVYSNQVTVTTTGGSTLSAGTATAGSATATTATAIATEASGGTAPYAHQWYRSSVVGQVGSPVVGQMTLTLADTGLTPGTTYYYQLKYTDVKGSGSSVLSNQVAITTTGGGTTSPAKRIVFPYPSTPKTSGSSRAMRRPVR